MKIYEKSLKRILDICIASFTLLLLSPVIIIVAILVKLKLGSPVIFTQERPGLNEKVFKLYKFRTMTSEKDKDGNYLPDYIRLTKFGKILRLTSLDELPELWNIIIGDMSIVGPRPLRVQYLPYYSNDEKLRHTVRPGLSGLAQVNGRNNLNWDEMLRYDVEYSKNISLLNDVKIIIATIFKVLKREGIEIIENDRIEDFDVYRKKKGYISK